MTVFLFATCEKEIDISLHTSDKQIVIEGLVRKDSLIHINITNSMDFYSENLYLPVYGALVTITDSEGNKEVLEQNEYGYYKSGSMKGKENITYNLHVLFEGMEYTSTSTMPEAVEIDEVKMYYMSSLGYAVPMVVFRDPPSIENYYRAILYVNRKRMDIGNEAIDAQHRDGVLIERLLPVFDDNKEDSRKVEKGDTIIVELQSIDKGVFTFFDTFGKIGTSQANPETNIKGGALGYFSAYSFAREFAIAD